MYADSWLIALIFVCILTVAFAYTGYPVLVFLLAKLFGRSAQPIDSPVDRLPFVSLLIAAHNEQSVIEQRLRNALGQDYPEDKFEIVIASDGSTDDTNAIVRRMATLGGPTIRLIDFPNNSGKASVLDKSMAQLRGEIVVLSDANTAMRSDAIRRLVSWFPDPAVGVVCGRLVMTDPVTGNNVDSLYWKYETFLKKCESRLGALLGSNGAIYAIRKNLIPSIPRGTVLDDFYIPLEAKRQSGCRIVYDSHAVACEETAHNIGAEFQRRVRIGAGGFQSIGLLWPLLSPAHGWISLSFLCHKMLRWLCPFLLVIAFLANFFALDSAIGRAVMAAQLAGYALALIGTRVPVEPRFLRFLRLPSMFVAMNAAIFVGFFKWSLGKESGVWKCTGRSHADGLQFATTFATSAGSRQARELADGSMA